MDSDAGTPERDSSVTTIKFTRDMAESLLRCFENNSTDGVVTLEKTEVGVWLVRPYSSARCFIGQAEMPLKKASIGIFFGVKPDVE